MGKKLSGIAFGQRTKQKGQSDTDQLVALKRFLKDRFDMDFKREWYVGFEQEQNYLCRIAEEVGRNESRKFIWKNPDLLCIDRKYGLIIIELDGAVHDRKVRKTQERNKLFTGAGIKLIVLNISDIKESGKTIKEACECEMLKLIGHGQC
jgi:hypothetical protein